MEESTTMNFTNEMINKVVNIVLKNGATYQGKLKAFDIHTNVVLEDCKEISSGKRRKLVFIIGRNLTSCSLNE